MNKLTDILTAFFAVLFIMGMMVTFIAVVVVVIPLATMGLVFNSILLMMEKLKQWVNKENRLTIK